MKPRIQCALTHWKSGFIARSTSPTPPNRDGTAARWRAWKTDRSVEDLDSRTAWVSAALSHVHLVSIGAAP